jgi:nicotinamidase-related amidase
MGPSGTMDAARSALLVVDVQGRLMRVIEGAVGCWPMSPVARCGGALGGASFVTEQNPRRLGGSVPEIASRRLPTLPKMSFDATRESGFHGFLPEERTDLAVAGGEAHVCVMQTVLGLIGLGRRVRLVRDAVGARRAENREAPSPG